jgi:altronate dehydratase small subunit
MGRLLALRNVFVVEREDNVGTAVGAPIAAGEKVGTDGRVTDLSLVARADIPYGHKLALRDIAAGEQVVKYGLSIGSASTDIRAGDHVHVHNVESNRGRGDKYVQEEDDR